MPTTKVSKKMSPPKELSLKEQAITQTQATAACTKEETLAVKRHTLQVASGDLKPGKARRPLELPKKKYKEAGADKEDICAVYPPDCDQCQGALEQHSLLGCNVPQ